MKKLTIIQMNDSHAYLEMHPELFWEKGRAVYRNAGGYARIASLLQKARAEHPGKVLFLDGGDTFHGTYPAVQTDGLALAPILNALEPAAMTAHWEFAYTPQGFKSLTQHLNYPMLAINIYEKESDTLFFQPYQMIEMAGLRIGIIGIASNIVDKVMPPEFSQGLYFTNGLKELPDVVQKLRNQEKAELIVLISHLGFPQDMHLIQQAPGVDVVLSAHTHHRLEHVVHQGKTLVVQSGSHGSFLTRLDIEVENGSIVDYQHTLIEVNEAIQPDAEVESLVQSALQPYRELLAQVVGHTRKPLNRGFNLETTMDTFLLTTLLEHTGAEIGFSNGWRYGAPIPAGPIRLNDLYNMVPMNPPVSTINLSGKELKKMLEENLEHTFSRDPFAQMGGYVKRALGLRVFFKVENPPGERIHKIFVGEREIRSDEVYRAAFITEQGVPPNLGHNRQQHPEKIIPVMQTYLKKFGPLEIEPSGAFQLI